jgi:hypothetical protein
MNETATTGEQNHDVVKIRMPRYSWMPWLVGAPIFFALAAQQFRMPPDWVELGWPSLAVLQFAVGCLWVGKALWDRARGVDLTPEYANVRSLRRQSIPWKDVQAVVQYQRSGTWVVRLILESGKPVTLAAPATWSGFGGAQYERDFHRIGQWWLAHRGEAWGPVRPEAPQLPAQR